MQRSDVSSFSAKIKWKEQDIRKRSQHTKGGLARSSQGPNPMEAGLPHSVGGKKFFFSGAMSLIYRDKCWVQSLSQLGHGRLQLLSACSQLCCIHAHWLHGVTRTHSSPSADTHHVPLLHTVAALNDGRPGGNTAACRGDVTLRPSEDGVGPWLTPFLGIPTILQGNRVRISTSPTAPTHPSSHVQNHLLPLPTTGVKELNKKINIYFAPIRPGTVCFHRIRLREVGQSQEKGKDSEGKPEQQWACSQPQAPSSAPLLMGFTCGRLLCMGLNHAGHAASRCSGLNCCTAITYTHLALYVPASPPSLY